MSVEGSTMKCFIVRLQLHPVPRSSFWATMSSTSWIILCTVSQIKSHDNYLFNWELIRAISCVHQKTMATTDWQRRLLARRIICRIGRVPDQFVGSSCSLWTVFINLCIVLSNMPSSKFAASLVLRWPHGCESGFSQPSSHATPSFFRVGYANRHN